MEQDTKLVTSKSSNVFVREARMTWDLVKDNFDATIFLGSVCGIWAFAVAFWIGDTSRNYENVPWFKTLLVLWMKFLPFATLYIISFEWRNQIIGLEEDRINKPHRPIASGQISLSEAQNRLILANIAFIVYAWLVNTLNESLIWVALIALYGPLIDKFWALKNLVFISLGTYAQVKASCIVMDPIGTIRTNPLLEFWLIGISLQAGIGIHLQDLRDHEGDLKINRKTLSVIFGMKIGRQVSAVFALAGAAVFAYTCLTISNCLMSYCLSIGYLVSQIGICCVLLIRDDLRSMQIVFRLWNLSWICFSPPSIMLLSIAPVVQTT